MLVKCRIATILNKIVLNKIVTKRFLILVNFKKTLFLSKIVVHVLVHVWLGASSDVGKIACVKWTKLSNFVVHAQLMKRHAKFDAYVNTITLKIFL